MVRVGHLESHPGCVAECGTSCRCGLMLTLATDLLLWVLAVTNDSMHREIEAELSALMEKLSGTEETRTPTPNAHTYTHTHMHMQTGYTPSNRQGSANLQHWEQTREARS